MFFKSFKCDCEVDDCDFDSYFWKVVRIRQLCCHQQFEVVVVACWLTSEADRRNSVFHKYCFKQNIVDIWIDFLEYIFSQNYMAKLQC